MNRIFLKTITALLLVGLFMACAGCEIKNSNETEASTSQQVTDEAGIKSQVEDYAATIVISGMSAEEATELYSSFVLKHPEYFWLSSTYSYQKTAEDTTEITIKYPYSSDKLKSMKSDLDNKVQQILLAAKARNGEYERAIFVHDYIINNCEYATSMVDTVSSAETDQYFAENNAYGCLLGGSALCGGYAKAYCLIMNKLDQDCVYVTGDMLSDGIAHAWNVVKMDGEYYHVDVTFDDPVANGDNAKADLESYTFFGLTTEEIKKDRTIDNEESIPECTATADNYFIHEGYFLETYNIDSCAAIINEQIASGVARIKFASEEECNKAIQDLFKAGKFNQTVANISVSYYASHSVLTIIKK